MGEYRPVHLDADYRVGSDGSIWSKKSGEWVRLSGDQDKDGYRTVKIRGKKHTVHSLVLTAFVGPRPKGLRGLHKNDVKTDNRVENLYWGTHRENMEDALKNGRVPALLGAEKAREIVRLRAAGLRQNVIAARLGTTAETVKKVLQGKLWADVTGIRPRKGRDSDGRRIAAGAAWLKTWGWDAGEIAPFLDITLDRTQRILRGESYSRVTGPGGLDLLPNGARG